MALSIKASSAFTTSRASVSRPAVVPRVRVVRTQASDNIYHDRETTKSRKSNPAGSKDAAVRKSEKDQQFEYQQERLEWRRKNQQGGDAYEDRVEPPVTNMAKDMSAERRGPDVEDSGPHGDTLHELVDNVKDALTGKKHKQDRESK